jgi:hypothetical protein
VARNPLWDNGGGGSFLDDMSRNSMGDEMKEAADLASTEDVKAGMLLRGSWLIDRHSY